MAIDTEERTGNSQPSSNNAGAVNNASTGPTPEGAVANNNKKVITIILLIVGVLILLGIISTIAMGFIGKKVFEGGIEAATGGAVKVDADSKDGMGTITIRGEDGDSYTAGAAKELPRDYPSFTPDVYKGAKLVATSRTVIDGTTRFTANYEVPGATISDIVSYYEDELDKIGFKVSMSTQSDSSAMLMAAEETEEGEDQRSLMISVTSNDSGEPLNLAVSPSISVAEKE